MTKNILYGINGEGLGHFSRSSHIIKNLLNKDYNVLVAKPPSITQQESNFIPIDFISLKMSGSRISLQHLIRDYISFFIKIEKRIQSLEKYPKPDIVISDFEPLTAYYARKHRIPLLSLDNQHRFYTIPKYIDYKMKIIHLLMILTNKLFIGHVSHSIVTCFHPHPNAYPVIINDQDLYGLDEENSDSPYYLCYVRQSIASELEYLKKDNNIIFANNLPKPEFIKLLRKSSGVITHAGNQLLGECVFYNKPITCIPIRSQIEQYANAYYLKKFKWGDVYNDTKNIKINKSNPPVVTDSNNRIRNGYFAVCRELDKWINTR